MYILMDINKYALQVTAFLLVVTHYWLMWQHWDGLHCDVECAVELICLAFEKVRGVMTLRACADKCFLLFTFSHIQRSPLAHTLQMDGQYMDIYVDYKMLSGKARSLK